MKAQFQNNSYIKSHQTITFELKHRILCNQQFLLYQMTLLYILFRCTDTQSNRCIFKLIQYYFIVNFHENEQSSSV